MTRKAVVKRLRRNLRIAWLINDLAEAGKTTVWATHHRDRVAATDTGYSYITLCVRRSRRERPPFVQSNRMRTDVVDAE